MCIKAAPSFTGAPGGRSRTVPARWRLRSIPAPAHEGPVQDLDVQKQVKLVAQGEVVEQLKDWADVLSQGLQQGGQGEDQNNIADGGRVGAGNEEVDGHDQGQAAGPDGEGGQGQIAQQKEAAAGGEVGGTPVQPQQEQGGQGVDGHQDCIQQEHDQEYGGPAGQVDPGPGDAEGDLIFQGVVLVLLRKDQVAAHRHQPKPHNHAQGGQAQGEGQANGGDPWRLSLDEIQAVYGPHSKQGAGEEQNGEIGAADCLVPLRPDGTQHQAPSFPAEWPSMRERK